MNWCFENAQSVREMCAGTYKTEAALQATIIAAMAVSVAAAETFSCTVSTSGATAQDLQNCMRNLIESHFTVSLASSTLTISW